MRLHTMVAIVSSVALAGSAMAASITPEDFYAPPHPHLADSTWPIIHGNTYNQDSTLRTESAPTRTAPQSYKMISGQPVPVTTVLSGRYRHEKYDDLRVLWGNTRTTVTKVFVNRGQPVGSKTFNRTQVSDSYLSGAYALVSRQNEFITPRDMTIDVFSDEIAGDPFSNIRVRSIKLDDLIGWLTDEERIVGLSMSYDGHLVFATDRCRLGVVTQSGELRAYLPFDTANHCVISNSIAVDENGGIYFVTSTELVKVRWDGFNLNPVWALAYQSQLFQAPGKLGPGSGTSPTLLGSSKSQDRLVAITDGMEKMNLVLAWRDEIPTNSQKPNVANDARMAAMLPVTFGKKSFNQSLTEQSIVVGPDYGMFIVDNSYGDIGPVARAVARRKNQSLTHATIYLSADRNVAPFGVEKFVWDTQKRRLRSAWSHPETSCPNGIPAYNHSAGFVYCVGQRNGVWGIESMNWKTGAKSPFFSLGKNVDFNSFYAGIGVNDQGEIFSGAYGGILLFGHATGTNN